MTDLSNAIVTDFDDREWKYLSKQERKQVERNTPKHVLRAWRGERFDRGTSFKWTTWIFVIIPAILFAGLALLFGLMIYYNVDPTDTTRSPAVTAQMTGPPTDVTSDGRPCPDHHCEGGYATMGAWARANPDNPQAQSHINEE